MDGPIGKEYSRGYQCTFFVPLVRENIGMLCNHSYQECFLSELFFINSCAIYITVSCNIVRWV